jgi:hypothetical protein
LPGKGKRALEPKLSTGMFFVPGKSTWKPIAELNDCRKWAPLSSSQDVLAYVRIFTGEQTAYLGILERRTHLRCLELVTANDALKRKLGTIQSEAAQKLHLQSPSVVWKEDHRIVERNLIVLESSRLPRLGIYRSRETVYPDGRYQHNFGTWIVRGGLREIMTPERPQASH